MRRPTFAAAALAVMLILTVGAPASAAVVADTPEPSSEVGALEEAPEPSSEPDPVQETGEVVAPVDTAPIPETPDSVTEPVVDEIVEEEIAPTPPLQQNSEGAVSAEPTDADTIVVAEEEIVVEGPDFIAPTPVKPIFSLEEQACYTGVDEFDWTPQFDPSDGAFYSRTADGSQPIENGKSYTFAELGAEWGVGSSGERIGVNVYLYAIAKPGFVIDFEGIHEVYGININNSGLYCPEDEEPECVSYSLQRIGFYLRSSEGGIAEAETRSDVDQPFCEDDVVASLVTYQGSLVFDYDVSESFTIATRQLVADVPDCDASTFLIIGGSFPEVLSEDSFEGRLVSSTVGTTACNTPEEPTAPVIEPNDGVADGTNIPKVDVTTLYESSIGYQVVESVSEEGATAQLAAFSSTGEEPTPVYQHFEVPPGTYTVTLPPVEPGKSIIYQVVVSHLDDSIPVFESELIKFTAPEETGSPVPSLVNLVIDEEYASTCAFLAGAVIEAGPFEYVRSGSNVYYAFYDGHVLAYEGEKAWITFRIKEENPDDDEVLVFNPEQPGDVSEDGQIITLTFVNAGVGDDCLPLPEPTVKVKPGAVSFINNADEAIQVFYNESGLPDLEGPIVIDPGQTGSINTTIEYLYWEAYSLDGLRFAGSGFVVVPQKRGIVTPPKGKPDNRGKPDGTPGKGSKGSKPDKSHEQGGKSAAIHSGDHNVSFAGYMLNNGKTNNTGLAIETGVAATSHKKLAQTGVEIWWFGLLAATLLGLGAALVAMSHRPARN